MKKLSLLIIALVATVGVQRAMAWGGFGHASIAYVAEQHLTPKAKAECRCYLKHTLPFYASWMDHWRAVPPFQKTNSWHGFSATSDGQVDWSKGNGKAMGQVQNILKTMGNGQYLNLPDSLVRHNLLILVHALPDMHCPVHVGFSKKDYPEYRYSLRRKGKPYKMHSFWDDSPGFQRKGWTCEKYYENMEPLSKGQAKKVKKGTGYDWTQETADVSRYCFTIMTKDKEISKMTKEEVETVHSIVDKQMQRAAYRLAGVLEEIFKY